MKVLALPRDPNPYQALLYGACTRRGMRVRYVGELTPSHTLNLLLLPAELVALRLAGWRILHVHWVFRFAVEWLGRLPGLRHLPELWFALVLATARAVGLHVVWTAHNVLPHARVFPDDVAARRRLVHSARLVIAHSQAVAELVARRFGKPRRVAVIPLPPYPIARERVARQDDEPPALLFFGHVVAYKGVTELLEAFGRVAGDADMCLTVAGRCPDDDLREELARLAAPWPGRAKLRLDTVPDEELPELLGAHDVLVLPFRDVTTSSTVVVGLGAGMPVLVPDLPVFDGLPVMRHIPGVAGLAAALREIASMDRAELDRRGDAGTQWAEGLSWEAAAGATERAFRELLDEQRMRRDRAGLLRPEGVVRH